MFHCYHFMVNKDFHNVMCLRSRGRAEFRRRRRRKSLPPPPAEFWSARRHASRIWFAPAGKLAAARLRGLQYDLLRVFATVRLLNSRAVYIHHHALLAVIVGSKHRQSLEESGHRFYGSIRQTNLTKTVQKLSQKSSDQRGGSRSISSLNTPNGMALCRRDPVTGKSNAMAV